MAELVDASDSKSDSARSAGSIPARGTTLKFNRNFGFDALCAQNRVTAVAIGESRFASRSTSPHRNQTA
jgi:hypothetical protein